MSDGRTAYQDLLTLWKDADPDIPVLEQARAEFAELQLLQIFSSHPDDPRKRSFLTRSNIFVNKRALNPRANREKVR